MKDLEDKQLSQLLDHISVSSEVKAMGEEMREPIFWEVRRRINGTTRRTLRIKIAITAASIALLFGVTNYFSYQQGYKEQNSQLVEMKNPLGMRSSVVLPDGTNVLLNAGTILRYPSAFVSAKREVEIEGEAFFEVTHDTKRPFVVKAGGVSVNVFGTKFNVKSYGEDPTIEITLTEGKVGVGMLNDSKLVYIDPEDQLIFNKKDHEYFVRQVNINQYVGWCDGKFHFKSIKFEEIVKQLERNFNVKIYIATVRLRETLFTGDFVNGENLEQILRIITTDQRVNYRMDKNQVYIEEK